MRMINDLTDTVEISADFYTVDLDGARHPLRSARATCRPDRAMTLDTISAGDIPQDHLLFWDFRTSAGGAGRGHHVMNTYKALDLAPSGIAHGVSSSAPGVHDIALATTGLALFVVLEADIAGRFSDNAFDMLAGEKRTITFIADDPSVSPQFTLRDLQSCQASA
jgi:beta-mannosidase